MLSHVVRKLRLLIAPPAMAYRHGIHWVAADTAAVPDPAAMARGTVVKVNRQRHVLRVGATYVKLTRANSPRGIAREILRPPKACLEYENAIELLRRGVPTAEPLAWGSRHRRRPSVSILVTREVAGAVPLNEAPASRALTVAFARALAAMHEAGVDHPDPHPGNFLVNAGVAPPQFTVMDVHAVRFSGPLPWRRTRAALVLLNRFYQAQGHAADRLRFWRAYLAARPSLADLWNRERDSHCTKFFPPLPRFGGEGEGGVAERNNVAPDVTLPVPTGNRAAVEVEAATVRSNRRFWTARLSRYTADNRETHRISRRRIVGYAERVLSFGFVEGMFTDPDRLFTGVTLLKDSPSSTVAVSDSDGERVILKRFRVKSGKVLLKNAFRPTPALRSWVLGRNLLDRGLPTARPLLMAERFRYGVPREGYVVFEHLPDALGLDDAVRGTPGRETLTLWAGEVGRLLRRMHDREVSHRDLKAANVLMVGVSDPATARPVLIDLVGVTVGRPVRESQRRRDLARLAVSFPAGALPNAVRVAFLKAYLGPRSGGAWKVWWRALTELAAAKVKRNERRGRPLA